jgi:hypothetical protein
MCKEQKWRYRCGCHTTAIQPCRKRCFENEHPEIGLLSMPRDPGRPPCAFATLSDMDDCSGWRRPTECLAPTAYVVDAQVCLRGSSQRPELMGLEESKQGSVREGSGDEKSALGKESVSRNHLMHGILWERPSRWRKTLVSLRK